MRRSASEIIRNLEMRIARLERKSSKTPSKAVLKLATLLKRTGNNISVEPWKDGSMGISIRHQQMDFKAGHSALLALKGDITNLKKKFLKGSFSYMGNEFLFQPYKGYTFIIPLTD